MSGIINYFEGAAYNDEHPIEDDENHKCPPHDFRHNIGLNGIRPFQYWACHYCHVKKNYSIDNKAQENNPNKKSIGRTSDKLKGKTHD